MEIYSTLHTFLHYADDYIKLLLHTDITKGGSTLAFKDIVCSDFSLTDYNDIVVFSLSSGYVFDNEELVMDNGSIVYNTNDVFSYSSTDYFTWVYIKCGSLKDLWSGCYSIKLQLRFITGEILTFRYKEALQILCNY